MIYLRYIYQKSGLPEPAGLGLQINDDAPVQQDVLDEFSLAFPNAVVRKSSAEDGQADVLILALREEPGWLGQVKWGRPNLPRARLGLGFFNISERTLILIPRDRFYSSMLDSGLALLLGTVIGLCLKVPVRVWKQA